MSDFDNLCKSMEELDAETFNKLFHEKSAKIITALAGLTEDGADGVSIFLDFILAAVAADGNLSKAEYELLKPMFDSISGHEVDYEEAVRIFNAIGVQSDKDLTRYVDNVIHIIGQLSPDLKNDLILFSLMICAIDGKVTESEKKFISQLVAPEVIEVTPMEAIDSYLTRAGVFVLASDVDGQPRMRVLGYKAVLDGNIYFAVGEIKEVYQQLLKNPKCEILATVGPEFVRWDGNAKFVEDARLDADFEERFPEITKVYKGNNVWLKFFTLEGGTAEIVKVDNTKIKLF